MSTPKAGAMAAYFGVRKFSGKRQNSEEFPIARPQYPSATHIFFTELTHWNVRI
jgi:hypothetical protein